MMTTTEQQTYRQLRRSLCLLGSMLAILACSSKTRTPTSQQIKTGGFNAEGKALGGGSGAEQPALGGIRQGDQAPELVLYEEGVAANFVAGAWDDNKHSIEMKDIDSGDATRGKIWDITKQGSGPGNIYIGVKGGASDLSTLNDAYLMFDIRIVKMTGTGLRVKIDSGWPATSDVTLHSSAHNIWQTMMIPLHQLKGAENSIEPGNKVNMGSVQLPFVLEPMSREAWQFQLDNIKISTDSGELPRQSSQQVVIKLESSTVMDHWDNNSDYGQVAKGDGGDDVHRDVIIFKKKAGGPGNAFLKFAGSAVDLRSFSNGFLSFDMKIVSLERGEVRLKMDSNWPATSDIAIEQPPLGEWKPMRVPVSKFFVDNSLQAGKRFNIAAVTNPLVIEPATEGGWEIHIDRVFLTADGSDGVASHGSGGSGSGGGSGGVEFDEAKWSLVWSDEFSGDRIDEKKWEHEVNCWGGGNGEKQCYTNREKNSLVKNGTLRIVAHKETFTGRDNPDGAGASKTQAYTSARLRTLGRGDFQYGRICARAKLPMGKGVWPAIWMLPTEWKYGPWPMSGEIDIMEARNIRPSEPTEIFGTLHFGGDMAKGRWQYKGPKNVIPGSDDQHPGLNFHTYCVVWDDDAIHWEIDGKNYGHLSQWHTENDQGKGPFPAPFDQKFHIILNVAIGGNFAGDPDEATVAAPEAMEVDWVRVFTCKANPLKPSKC